MLMLGKPVGQVAHFFDCELSVGRDATHQRVHALHVSGDHIKELFASKAFAKPGQILPFLIVQDAVSHGSGDVRNQLVERMPLSYILMVF